MAERINDDEDNHSDVQGRIPRVLLVKHYKFFNWFLYSREINEIHQQ